MKNVNEHETTCRFWNLTTASSVPYVPGEAPRDRSYIKLNTNENPYPPSPGVFKALEDFDAEVLRRYPDHDLTDIRAALASYTGLEPEQIFIGNGSDEVLAFAFQAFFERSYNGGKPIVFADHTYSFYKVYANLFDIPYKLIPLASDFTIDPAPYLESSGGVVLANPNAPTAIALEPEVIEKIVRARPDRLVIVDEAYVDYGAKSVLPLVKKHDNLLVVQTFSKSRSMASLRIGYACGHPDLIEGLSRMRDSFNSYTVDVISQVLAKASLEDEDYFQEKVKAVIDARSSASARLRQMGYILTDSKTNFIWATHPKFKGQFLYEKLKEAGILIRHFKTPGIQDHIRITVGTPEEMEQLCEVLEALVREEEKG